MVSRTIRHASVVDDTTEERVGRRFREEYSDLGPYDRLCSLLREEAPLLSDGAVDELARRLEGELVGLGQLQTLLDDPEVTDVLANGPGVVWVERAGQLSRSSVIVDSAQIERAIERLVSPLGLRADRTCPVVDARLPDGTRVAAVLSPLAVDGPVLAVRRHLRRSLPLGAFVDAHGLDLIERRLEGRPNVIVFGATGSGKTTVVNAMVALLGTEERIVTIEDVAELQLPGRHVVRLEARPGTSEGIGRVEMRDLVRAALRLRPDRIVVGEVRGPEASDMIWAMATGHRGGFSTCHAGSAADALDRIETMCLMSGDGVPHSAVRAQVRSAVDLCVGVERSGDGRRAIVSVHEVGPDGPGPDLLGRPL